MAKVMVREGKGQMEEELQISWNGHTHHYTGAYAFIRACVEHYAQ